MNVCENVLREPVRELSAAPKRLLRDRATKHEEHELKSDAGMAAPR